MVRIVCDGNSLTYGSYIPAGQPPYPTQLQTLLGAAEYSVINRGAPSQTTAYLLANFNSRVHPYYSASATANIVLLWEVTNHAYFGASAATCKQAVSDYCALAKSKGWTVIIGTAIQRGSAAVPMTTWRAVVAEVNQWMRDNWESMADGLADFAHGTYSGTPEFFDIPFTGNGVNPPYVDTAHLEQTGYAVIASLARDSIYEVLSVDPIVDPPVLAINAVVSPTTSASQLVTGTATGDGVTLTVNGTPVTITAGAWSYNATLAPGVNTITAVATNDGGTTSATTSIDYQPIVVPVQYPDIKVYSGGNWLDADMYVAQGGEWVPIRLYRGEGGQWI